MTEYILSKIFKPGEIVSEIKIVLDNENREENKLKYKKEILNILGL